MSSSSSSLECKKKLELSLNQTFRLRKVRLSLSVSFQAVLSTHYWVIPTLRWQSLPTKAPLTLEYMLVLVLEARNSNVCIGLITWPIQQEHRFYPIVLFNSHILSIWLCLSIHTAYRPFHTLPGGYKWKTKIFETGTDVMTLSCPTLIVMFKTTFFPMCHMPVTYQPLVLSVTKLWSTIAFGLWYGFFGKIK